MIRIRFKATFSVLLAIGATTACNPKDSIPENAQNPPTSSEGDINYIPLEDWNKRGQHAGRMPSPNPSISPSPPPPPSLRK